MTFSDEPEFDILAGADDEPMDVVTSVGDLDRVVALLRAFIHDSGAIRSVAVVEREGEAAAIVDCERLKPIEVTAGGRTVALPHAIDLDVPEPDVPKVRQLPPFEVDAASGEIAAPMGGMEHYAEAVIGLSRRLGPRDVALATWHTNDAAAPLTITARGNDPVVVALGEDSYEMDPGWPPPAAGI